MSSSRKRFSTRADRLDHRGVVPLAEHAALRVAGGARRVEERQRVVQADLGARLVQRARVLGRVGAPRRLDVGQRPARAGDVDADHPLEGGQLDLEVVHLRELLGVLGDQHLRLGVAQDELDLGGRRSRIDRDHDRADRRQGVVGECPLEPRAAQDRDLVALLNVEGEEAVRQRGDAVGGLLPADLAPAVGFADEERGARTVGADALPPQLADRRAGGLAGRGLLDCLGHGRTIGDWIPAWTRPT